MEAKLLACNPWLEPDAARSVIERLEAVPATLEGNREILSGMRGERSVYDVALLANE